MCIKQYILFYTYFIHIYIYIVAGGANDRHSGRGVRPRNNKKVSKGDEVSKINRGSGVLVVLRGL